MFTKIQSFLSTHPEVESVFFDGNKKLDRLTFASGTSREIIDSTNLDALNFDWTEVPIDFDSFTAVITSDTSLSRIIRINLIAQFPIWKNNISSNTAACKTDWEEMKTEGWLNPEAINKIESWALTYNVPII